jgi:hypothetical protein
MKPMARVVLRWSFAIGLAMGLLITAGACVSLWKFSQVGMSEDVAVAVYGGMGFIGAAFGGVLSLVCLVGLLASTPPKGAH